MAATYSFRPNSYSNFIGMSDWLCRNCKIQVAMMLTNRNKLQGKYMFYILTAIRGRYGVWSSEFGLWLMKRFIDQRCGWNEQGQLWTDWLLKEFMLQKLAEQQAKRRAEAVELVMQGLEQRLQNFLMSLAETGKDVTSLYWVYVLILWPEVWSNRWPFCCYR